MIRVYAVIILIIVGNSAEELFTDRIMRTLNGNKGSVMSDFLGTSMLVHISMDVFHRNNASFYNDGQMNRVLRLNGGQCSGRGLPAVTS